MSSVHSAQLIVVLLENSSLFIIIYWNCNDILFQAFKTVLKKKIKWNWEQLNWKILLLLTKRTQKMCIANVVAAAHHISGSGETNNWNEIMKKIIIINKRQIINLNCTVLFEWKCFIAFSLISIVGAFGCIGRSPTHVTASWCRAVSSVARDKFPKMVTKVIHKSINYKAAVQRVPRKSC